jgi:DNA-binding HxlR family transcriptional regulator
MEEYGILTRADYPEVPPRIEYELTEKGQALNDAITHLCDWVSKWYSEELVIAY